MVRRIAIAAALTTVLGLLAACGACEGRVTNGGPSHGKCRVFSVDW